MTLALLVFEWMITYFKTYILHFWYGQFIACQLYLHKVTQKDSIYNRVACSGRKIFIVKPRLIVLLKKSSESLVNTFRRPLFLNDAKCQTTVNMCYSENILLSIPSACFLIIEFTLLFQGADVRNLQLEKTHMQNFYLCSHWILYLVHSRLPFSSISIKEQSGLLQWKLTSFLTQLESVTLCHCCLHRNVA